MDRMAEDPRGLRRIVRALVVRVLWSALLTATLMPVLVLTVPGIREDAEWGILLSSGVFVVGFLSLTLFWIRRRF
jgi:hypothetical protein